MSKIYHALLSITLTGGILVSSQGCKITFPGETSENPATPRATRSDSQPTDTAPPPVVSPGAAVLDVQVLPERVVIEKNRTQQASAFVKYDDNSVDSNVTWSTSDNSVVAISPDGQIKALKAGEVTIFATATRDNNIRSSIQVSVKPEVSVATIATITPNKVNMAPGSSQSIQATIRLSDGKESSNLSWSSSDSSVVIVHGSGSTGNLTALRSGTATITVVSDDDPTKTTTALVTVAAPTTVTTQSETPVVQAGVQE